jgi:CHAT domain-containing protein/Flp pilus assembly protein TadD
MDDARDLYLQGELRAALEAFQAIAEREVEDTDLAASCRNNACLILGNLAEYEAALSECREALRLRRLTDDPSRLARILNNLALVLEQLGRYAEARVHYAEALAINRRLGDAHGETINLINLAVLASQTDHHSEALRLYIDAADLAHEHRAEAWAGEQARLARINQGVELERLGAFHQALDLYKEARETAFADRGWNANLAMNIGVVYRNLGDPVRAVAAFEEAAEVFEDNQDTASLANALLNLGLARHLNLHLPVAAESAFRRALELAEKSGDRAEEMRGHYYLGRLLLDLERREEAAVQFEQCLRLAEATRSPEGRWSAREGLGRVAMAGAKPSLALSYFLAALADIERVRDDLGASSRLRAGYFGEKRPVYEATVRVLAHLASEDPVAGHVEKALEVVQRAKARELLDSLGSRPGTAAPLPAKALLDRVGDAVLIEYFAAEGHLYVWRLHQQQILFLDLGRVDDIFAAIGGIHRALAQGNPLGQEALAKLSATLLRPLEGLRDSGKKLYIAPDGRLHYLPFEILKDPLSGGNQLVRRFAIAYLPSASTLVWLSRGKAVAGKAWIGFGAPDLEAEGMDPLSPSGMLMRRFHLGRLPAARRELQMIGERIPGSHVLRLGAEATESAFRIAVSEGSHLTHLATHTVIDERSGRGAAILLTPDDQEDGLLYPAEIAGLEAPTHLTVLAACSTAFGLSNESQALASLTGAFLAAGSQAVLATLWDVDDAGSAAFMEQFYFQLGRGLAPAEALRETKNRFLGDARWNRPEHWAAFVLIGEGAPPVRRGRRYWPWLLAALVAAGLLRQRGMAALGG